MSLILTRSQFNKLTVVQCPSFSYLDARNGTHCERDLLRARGWQVNGKTAAVFMPECRPDGSYAPEQCDKSTGQCWCVDKNGNELVGTRANGRRFCRTQGLNS